MKDHDIGEYKRQLLDLLCRTDEVLTTASIEYFGVFGTCLGAVREHGIIPWDDDIDIAVRRCDFERAIAVLGDSDRNIFVDRHGFRSARVFNRVQVSDSIERRRAYMDLYVIDYAPKSRLHFFWNVLWYVGISRIVSRRKGVQGESHPLLYFFADFFSFPFRMLPTAALDKVAEWFYVYGHESSFVKLSYDANRKRYLNRFFLTSRRVAFNETTIPVPDDYDAYLTMTYGDWRTPPSEANRASHAFDATGTTWNVKLPTDEERCCKRMN